MGLIFGIGLGSWYGYGLGLTFSVGVRSWSVVLVWEGTTVSWKIECDHPAFLPHAFVVQDAVVLTAVAACGVEEDDILVAFAG